QNTPRRQTTTTDGARLLEPAASYRSRQGRSGSPAGKPDQTVGVLSRPDSLHDRQKESSRWEGEILLGALGSFLWLDPHHDHTARVQGSKLIAALTIYAQTVMAGAANRLEPAPIDCYASRLIYI